jgi:hypothetical protein
MWKDYIRHLQRWLSVSVSSLKMCGMVFGSQFLHEKKNIYAGDIRNTFSKQKLCSFRRIKMFRLRHQNFKCILLKRFVWVVALRFTVVSTLSGQHLGPLPNIRKADMGRNFLFIIKIFYWVS